MGYAAGVLLKHVSITGVNMVDICSILWVINCSILGCLAIDVFRAYK